MRGDVFRKYVFGLEHKYIIKGEMKMIRFNNDYNHGAHPAILEAVMKTNTESYGGYGLDSWSEKGAAAIRKYLEGADADIHFLLGGTQVNYTVIAAALRPYQSVISAVTAHINHHETGAVENTGHKIQAVPGENGKLTAAGIAAAAEAYRRSGTQEHITQPKLVFLSFPSEYGTIYTRQELMDIHAVCREYDLYLFVDGARLGYGLGSQANDVTLADLARLTDAFYIGGTKCGAMFGEAVVLMHPALRENFRSFMKQNGAMLAKGWLLGLQFYTLFQDGLYFRITEKADEAAMQIKDAFSRKGIPFYMESFTNQQFVLLTESEKKRLAEKYIFEEEEVLSDGRSCVRFCTSWSTTPEEAAALVSDIQKL